MKDIDLRWRKVPIHEKPPAAAIPIEGQIVTEYRVLQYREKIDIDEWYAYEEQWTHWHDVPVVDETTYDLKKEEP